LCFPRRSYRNYGRLSGGRSCRAGAARFGAGPGESTGHVIDVNPAHAVRGPKYVVKKGKTPVLTAGEARTLLNSIPIIKRSDESGGALESPDLMGLRDRALIGLMAYSFARVGAVLKSGDNQSRCGRKPRDENERTRH
jgi:integrase